MSRLTDLDRKEVNVENVAKISWSVLMILHFTLMAHVLFAVYSPSTRDKTARSVVLGADSLGRISLLLLFF